MGCGASFGSRQAYAAPPDLVAAGDSYTKLVETPGGSVVQTRGYAIDHRLPLVTPGGSAVDRRDYDRDPLTAVEAEEIQRAIERTRAR